MIRIDNCTVFDGLSEEPAEDCSILIEGGLIREIGNASASNSVTRRIDACGRFLLPGLIDAHFHAYGIELNPAMVDRIRPELRGLHAKRILEAALMRGFTTVRDAAGGDIALATALRIGLIHGPHFFYPGLAISQTGGHGDLRALDHYDSCLCAYCGSMSVVADGPDEVRKVAREQLRLGATHIKLFVSGGVLSPSDPLWMNQLSADEIVAAVEEAQSRRTYVMAHAHTNEAVLRCLKSGVRSIEHATILEDDGAAAIVAHGAFAVPTLAIIEAIRGAGDEIGLPQQMVAKVQEVGDHALRSLERLRTAGAKIGFGTDLMGPLMSQQSIEFRLRREVCTPFEILRSCTSVNAELLQMSGKIGEISPGANADLLIVDGNPLEDVTLLEDADHLRLIMLDGEVVKNSLN